MKYVSLCMLLLAYPGLAQRSVIRDHVTIEVYTYEDGNLVKAAAMPEIKTGSTLQNYKRRFDYLLINISEIHQPDKAEERQRIFSMYPDTLKLKTLYLEKYVQDKKLTAYFEETMAPVKAPNVKVNTTYTVDELVDVASKFFYCNKVNADTSVQSHVCIGINGLSEARWTRDYTLLAAFCYEAIFSDFDKDTSVISEAYAAEKKLSCKQFRGTITSLDKYLEDVKLDLFNRMRTNAVLKEALLAYYASNKHNLAFKLLN